MTAPIQKPGRSKQDYGTPWELVRAVERRFGTLKVDLAAMPVNAKAKVYLTPEDDSLSVCWSDRFHNRLCWLNPPFANIGPWAAKCALEGFAMGDGAIILLTPASIGSNWFAKHVWPNAKVIALTGRLTFEGETTPYPKDCMMSVFGPWWQRERLELWDWRT